MYCIAQDEIMKRTLPDSNFRINCSMYCTMYIVETELNKWYSNPSEREIRRHNLTGYLTRAAYRPYGLR